MSLPVPRLRAAGASEKEISHLEADHVRLAPADQESREAHYAGIADADITEELKALRSGGYFREPEPTEPAEDSSSGTPVTDEAKVEADKPHDADKPATRAKK